MKIFLTKNWESEPHFACIYWPATFYTDVHHNIPTEIIIYDFFFSVMMFGIELNNVFDTLGGEMCIHHVQENEKENAANDHMKMIWVSVWVSGDHVKQ